MKKTILTGLVPMLFVLSGCAHDSMMREGKTESAPMHAGMEMKMMDANKDGMISREEFMKFHETMFDKMKGDNGQVNIKDMQMMGDMMKK